MILISTMISINKRISHWGLWVYCRRGMLCSQKCLAHCSLAMPFHWNALLTAHWQCLSTEMPCSQLTGNAFSTEMLCSQPCRHCISHRNALLTALQALHFPQKCIPHGCVATAFLAHGASAQQWYAINSMHCCNPIFHCRLATDCFHRAVWHDEFH